MALFARIGWEDTIVHVHNADDYEGLWLIAHTDRGPILIGLLYRPPARGDLHVINAFERDLALLRVNCVGTLVVSDFNAHEENWLRFSCGSSPEGRRLRDVH